MIEAALVERIAGKGGVVNIPVVACLTLGEPDPRNRPLPLPEAGRGRGWQHRKKTHFSGDLQSQAGSSGTTDASRPLPAQGRRGWEAKVEPGERGAVPPRPVPRQSEMRLAGNGAGEPCSLDSDAPLAATRDGRGQRLTSGGRSNERAVRCMGQGTPATFHAARSQERPPSGEVRRCPARFALPGALRAGFRAKGGTFAGLVPARPVPR